MSAFRNLDSVLVGLDDGMFVGHGYASKIANYREPGESGYPVGGPVGGDTSSMDKHYGSCVNATGHGVPCIMNPGAPYVECIDGCSLVRCPDEKSQRDCSPTSAEFESDAERTECEAQVKWCRQYVRKTAPSDADGTAGDRKLGFIPRSTNCIDATGVVSQTPGQIMKKGTDEPGSCYYADGTTPVQRTLSGPYAYCGDKGEVCNDTFVGAMVSRDYDPRWRSWYNDTRTIQRPNWSPPYLFFATLSMGITYSEPIYSTQEGDEESPSGVGRTVFDGVVAVDYAFDNITNFLVENYLNSSTTVAVAEEAEPHYMIASSTGSRGATKVRISDETLPCPVGGDSSDCKAVRTSILDMAEPSAGGSTALDGVIARAFAKQKDEGFPDADLVSVKADDSASSSAYISQTRLFEIPEADLSWRIIIMSPTEVSAADTILRGDSLFGFLIGIALLGFVVCLALLYHFCKHRTNRTIVTSDWRFTSAFILGCSLLNTASFSFLGPNTDSLCMLRMWLVHFFFALALSPLLVKTYRMMKLVGGRTVQRRVTISHFKAALYTLPIILTQTLILTIFSIVDPSRQVELIETNGADVTHQLICAHDTNAFLITELVYEGGLVFMGCVLAFKTRHLKGGFGEAKQLIIAMYNIALVGSVVLIVINVMDNGQAARRTLIAVGILWGTVFSCCAFVVPRLLRVREDIRRSIASTGADSTTAASASRVRVSGLRISGLQSSNVSSSATSVAKKNSRATEVKAAPMEAEEDGFVDNEQQREPVASEE
mmetsp:Transcript_20067/g.43780  ORF Transcript_20067/g.43780 Transcript_20067/m.43780 type:complete len:771 (-) Transcript_20067:110-2422(-)